jgi:hypothetical protein
VLSSFLAAYGDAGFMVLVAVVLGAVVFVLIRGRHAPRAVTASTVCPKCAGTGRFVGADGHTWPCLEAHP